MTVMWMLFQAIMDIMSIVEFLPPEITYSSGEKAARSFDVTFIIETSDGGGIGKVEILKDGDVKHAWNFADNRTYFYGTKTLNVGAFSGLLGTVFSVRVTDRHGNVDEKPLLTISSIFMFIADVVAEYAPFLLGPQLGAILSALTFYAAEEAEGFVALFMKPMEMVAGIVDFVKMAQEDGTDVIPKIAEAMGMMYWNAANDSNPYDTGTDDHETWQFCFHGTIVVIFIILAAYFMKNLKNLPETISNYKSKITTMKTKLSGFANANKGLDIVEDAADAAATVAKAGSRTTGPGKLKVLQDYFRNRRIACGGRMCPVPDATTSAPKIGTSTSMKVEQFLVKTGLYDNSIIQAVKRAWQRGIVDRRMTSIAEDLADFYKANSHADNIYYLDSVKYTYTGTTPENPDFLVKFSKNIGGEEVFIYRGIGDSEYSLWKKANGDPYNPRGVEHIIDKHLYGKPRLGQALQPDTTTFPSTMTKEEVIKAGLKVATEGKYIDSEGVFRGVIYHKGKPIVVDSVKISTGEVITSFPKAGVGVKKWDGSTWLIWSETANDFI